MSRAGRESRTIENRRISRKLIESPPPGHREEFILDDPSPYDPRYLEGIRHFNACDFFEAHEVWEDLWTEYQGPSRKFYQGLIQVAVCLHHFGNGNIRGAKKLYGSSTKYLGDYKPTHRGLDVDKLVADLTKCCGEILASQEEFPQIEIVPDLIPEIHLDPRAPDDERVDRE